MLIKIGSTAIDLLNHIVRVEQDLQSVQKENEKLREDITKFENTTTTLEGRCNDLEDRSRRYNLRIFGLPEDPDETWDNTRTKVADLCTGRLGLPEVRLEVAHRTGPRRVDKPRAVVARFQRIDDREAVMRNVGKLKQSGIHIHEDLCAASLKKRNDQWPLLRQHRNAGNFAKFVRHKLVVRESSNKTDNTDRQNVTPPVAHRDPEAAQDTGVSADTSAAVAHEGVDESGVRTRSASTSLTNARAQGGAGGGPPRTSDTAADNKEARQPRKK